MRGFALLLLLLPLAVPADGGRAAPPGRIVTLAPHLAELVYAAGAGDRLVGVSAYSDHPAEVADLPVVGDAFALDQEQLALLVPDLLLAWQSGTPQHVIDELVARGYRVETVRTRGLEDIASALRRIGALTGERRAAETAAARFEEQLRELRRGWADAAPIRVFFQVSARPLYTVNGEHYISEIVAVCGGVNVFAELGALAPAVGEEAVLERDPEVLLAPGVDAAAALGHWSRWSALAANRYGNRYVVPPAAVGRASPRLIDAAASICSRLDEARQRRAAGSAS